MEERPPRWQSGLVAVSRGLAEMAGHLRREVENIVWATREDAAAEGWRLYKTDWRFSYPLCPGVTLWLWPDFGYSEMQGLTCLSQPRAPVSSDLFGKAFKLVFGKPCPGPAMTYVFFGAAYPKRPHFDGLRRRFAKWPVRFVDIDYPEARPEDGYYPTETLPEYLRELRKAVLGVAAEDYDTASEMAFLNGLPKDIDTVAVRGLYSSDRGTFTAFAITQLLCGNLRVIDDIRASDVPLYPIEVEALAKIESAAQAIAALAKA